MNDVQHDSRFTIYDSPILLVGAQGQLGWELQRTAPAGLTLHALDRAALDITDAAAVQACVEALRPGLIINAAAYTAVDRAEQEPALAYAVNRDGPAHLAAAAAACGARLVHVSTDFVFDGTLGRPYRPEDPVKPLGVYGASKAAGEAAVREALGGAALILRTAWVYSAHGANFVKTMLRLMRERERLGVVADQVGTPTWARDLARALWRAAELGLTGTHHWTDAGVASWYDFAVAIQEEALALGLLTRPIPIDPIATADYPTPARRPAYSVLDKTAFWTALGRPAGHWRVGLRGMLKELRVEGEG